MGGVGDIKSEVIVDFCFPGLQRHLQTEALIPHRVQTLAKYFRRLHTITAPARKAHQRH